MNTVAPRTPNPRRRMPIPPRFRSAKPATLALLALLAACRGADGTGGEGNAGRPLPPAEERARAAFTLAPEAASDSSAQLGWVSALDVDGRGRVYVGDMTTATITVLRPDGGVERVVGRRGKGPGEFGMIANVQVLPGDSLLVFDREQARLTVFAPDLREVAYTTGLATPSGAAAVHQVERAPGGAGLIATYRRPFSGRDDPRDDATRKDVVRLLQNDARLLRDSVVVIPSQEFLVNRVGGGVMVALNPFGRRGEVHTGPGGRLYHASTDRLAFRVTPLSGGAETEFAWAFQPGPVTGDDVEKAVRMMGSNLRSVITEAAPGGWPAMDHFIVDDRGRVWAALNTPGERREWAVFEADGRYAGSAFGPRGLTLHRVRGGRAYGVESDEVDVPRVRVFRVGEPAAR